KRNAKLSRNQTKVRKTPVESFAHLRSVTPREGTNDERRTTLTRALRNPVRSGARMVHARIVGAVVVPVADHRLVAGAAELEYLVLRVDLVIAVRVDNPVTVAI